MVEEFSIYVVLSPQVCYVILIWGKVLHYLFELLEVHKTSSCSCHIFEFVDDMVHILFNLFYEGLIFFTSHSLRQGWLASWVASEVISFFNKGRSFVISVVQALVQKHIGGVKLGLEVNWFLSSTSEELISLVEFILSVRQNFLFLILSFSNVVLEERLEVVPIYIFFSLEYKGSLEKHFKVLLSDSRYF